MVSWGIKTREKAAFRPSMALASGELSAVGGKFLFMTATATSQTIRQLMDQLPELKDWKVILNSPIRDNISLLIAPPEMLSSNFEVTLSPFLSRMNELEEVYLILVRGINKGTHVYLHLLRHRKQTEGGDRRVAFYHRNTSEARKQEILDDLKKPLTCSDKKLLAVVATISLGKSFIQCFIQKNCLHPSIYKYFITLTGR